jgi:GDP-mannose 4,6 dehydratase
VAVDEAYFRPSEVPALIGDASKAAQKLGWTPKIGLEEIIQEMVGLRHSPREGGSALVKGLSSLFSLATQPGVLILARLT